MASALDENGTGHLTSVDSTRWQWQNPTPGEVLEKAGLSKFVTLDKNYSTYAWFLERELESAMDTGGMVRPKYDFIFLDGAKNWSTDGITVVVSERLLRPGGWLLLDDLGWTYEKHCANKTRHYEIDLTKLSDSERTQPHLRAIFDLLIRTNPAFDEFVVQDDWWGWARKSAAARTRTAVRRPPGREAAWPTWCAAPGGFAPAKAPRVGMGRAGIARRAGPRREWPGRERPSL